MKRVDTYFNTSLKGVEVYEGETLEQKVQRITENKEPITDSAPIIYTPKELGVVAGYNIRTDRFDVALEAMDAVAKVKIAKRNGKFDKEDIANNETLEQVPEPSDN